ncbi:uncharacterized protein LOC107817800 [Nicotiana tabacum]|uniref:Uncharacterized protein LOC107817800 n=1 Tax=Nicotiana tabacum TaxID=4097 RepID=A0A1S4CD65_TOBAC|nr:PREDICTED: uncharacterized protein LOC107817800 [Nicotiana tabacum]
MVVASMVIPKYTDPKTIYTPKKIQTDMLSDHGVNLTYMQAWRVKEKALEFLRGHPADSYSRLPSYLYILEKTYPGTVVNLKKTEDVFFLYAFVVLSTSIKGWEYCRPVVVVDGTFLKSAYKGIMLTASTMDAAGSILPLTYAIVDSENDAAWNWFFEQYKDVYGEKPNMCIISDRNESILKATSTVYTGRPHYACMWLIWINVRSKFRKGYLKISKLYFATTRSYTIDEFNERMSKNEEIDVCVKAYLYDIGYHRWSRVRASTDHIHTVLYGAERFIVYLQNKRCSCGQFHLDELPCPHALAALRHRDESYENYYYPYYMRESLLKTYETPVDPLPDESKWNVPQHVAEEVVKPPTGKRQPWRP